MVCGAGSKGDGTIESAQASRVSYKPVSRNASAIIVTEASIRDTSSEWADAKDGSYSRRMRPVSRIRYPCNLRDVLCYRAIQHCWCDPASVESFHPLCRFADFLRTPHRNHWAILRSKTLTFHLYDSVWRSHSHRDGRAERQFLIGLRTFLEGGCCCRQRRVLRLFRTADVTG